MSEVPINGEFLLVEQLLLLHIWKFTLIKITSREGNGKSGPKVSRNRFSIKNNISIGRLEYFHSTIKHVQLLPVLEFRVTTKCFVREFIVLKYTIFSLHSMFSRCNHFECYIHKTRK